MTTRMMTCAIPLLLMFAQPAAAAARVLFENHDVRVYEVTIAPGYKEPGFHAHAVPYVFYVLKPGRANVRTEQGGSTVVDYAVGEVGYGEVERHAVDNIGSSEIVVLIVDLKTTRAAKNAMRVLAPAHSLRADHDRYRVSPFNAANAS